MVDSQAPGAPDEGREFADLAAGGSRRIVLLSSRTYGEMGGDRIATEQALKESGVSWTILRPSWFAQNFTEFDMFAPCWATVGRPPRDFHNYVAGPTSAAAWRSTGHEEVSRARSL